MYNEKLPLLPDYNRARHNNKMTYVEPDVTRGLSVLINLYKKLLKSPLLS